MKIPVLYQIEKSIRGVKNKVFRKKKKAPFRDVEAHRAILRKYKYIHVMNNGIHSIGILRFIQKYFDNDEHAFIFPVFRTETQEKLADTEHVYHFYLTEIPWDTVDKVIFQGLFTPSHIEYLYAHAEVLKKCYWFIWGGDLYREDTPEEAFVKKNFAGILTSFDYEVYKEKFGENKCFDVTYPHDVVEGMLHDSEEPSPEKPVRVLVNNSADETTLEMLDILSRYKEENIEVHTILSYVSANQKDMRLDIMYKGFTTFGLKFKPLMEFMSKEDYANFLNTMDIYISNQNRQQGNGNAAFLCSLGKKIFTKADTSVNIKYNSIGIRYFDTYSIPELTFEEFCHYDEEVKNETVKRLKYRMLESTKAKQWHDFFVS